MRISDVLTPEVILPAIEVTGIHDAIEALAGCLAARHAEVDRAEFLAALRHRERQVGTALTDGVAIPHARIAGLSSMVAAFGRSPGGIECGSHDGKPTQFFLLLAVPAEQPGAHLKLLAAASRLLHDERCRVRLLGASDADALMEVLRSEEERAIRLGRAA